MFYVSLAILLLFAIVFVGGKILADKQKLLTDATVEFSNENGSIVRVMGEGDLLYRVEKKLERDSPVHVLDLRLVESTSAKDNLYLLLHCCHLKRLLQKKYYLQEAVFCYNDRGKQAVVQEKTAPNKWFAVDTKTKEPIYLFYVPQNIAAEKNPVVDYENLLLTPTIGIGVTEADC